MKNPGFDVFALVGSPGHSTEDDDFESGSDSDYIRPVGFGRWKTPGQSLRFPTHVGPAFKPGETPEDVVHGEIVSPEEQDGADKILRGEHESHSPSENPYVERARLELHTPQSVTAAHTLTGLLSGDHPSSVSPQTMDMAHDYLSRHFTGVRVNPHHGTLMTASPTGSQMVKRKTHLPAIPDKAEEEPTYSLTNKHGTFESEDPHRLVRTMLAFQIMHNELAAKKKREDDQGDDDDSRLSATSGIRDWLGLDKPAPSGPISWNDALRRKTKPSPAPRIPSPGAVFEPGHGTDRSDKGVRGGWVAHDSEAPDEWRRDSHGIAYSPGHNMNEMLDPAKATKPRPDPYFPGHTFTFMKSLGTGHTIERHGHGLTYFVSRVHPAARGAGFDLPPEVNPKPPAATSPKRRRKISPPIPPITSAVKANDLCPVCVSGYLEPYDTDTHECLNCGSLVKHIGFEKEAAAKRKPGGLGRGLKDIQPYEGDPLNLASGGSENPENVDEQVIEGGYIHPLADEEVDPDYVGYEAPKRLLDKTSGEADPLDEQLGKLGYFPIHKPGADQRAYLAPLPGTPGGYARLTEGVPHPTTGERGWVLTADQDLHKEPWTRKEPGTQVDKPYRQKSIPLDRAVSDPREIKQFRQPLRDLGERTMAEKSILATGHHPIDDDSLNRAARDLATNGRSSHTFQRTLDTAYEPPALPPGPGQEGTQRQKRLLSSVGNPGIDKFTV